MQQKKLVIASDHAGYRLKSILTSYLTDKGYQVIDCGTDSENISVDYPDEAQLLAHEIQKDNSLRGVLVCGSGIGMSIAINRYPFIRGALVHLPQLARLSRQHNDANVIIFGGRFIDESVAKECVDAFLETEFEGGRHLKRVEKLEGLGNNG